jgi:hypothetical protein
MKPIILFFLLAISSCQKEVSTPVEESQGSVFNILLKTVAQNVNGGGSTITTNYRYNTNGQLADITRTFDNPNGNLSVQKDVYYRNAGGRLDSITYINITNPQNPGFNNIYKTEFHYNNSGDISYTLNKSNLNTYPSDSIVYYYQVNRVSQRILYRYPGTATAYVLSATFNYTYDAAGNLSAMDVLWSNPNNSSRNCIYTYDAKINTLPVMEYENELYGNWVKAYDNIFTTSNNILSRRSPQGWDWDWGNKDYEYQYSANNKPLYQKVKHTDSPGFYEVKYYYD